MAAKSGGLSGNLTTHTLYEINERTDVPLNTLTFAFPLYGWFPRVVCGLYQAGNGTAPTIHSVYVDEAINGTYTLAYMGQETSALAWNATSSALLTALEGTQIGNVSITGCGTLASPFLVEHLDDCFYHRPFAANSSNLTGAKLWGFEYTPPGSGNTTVDSFTTTTSLTAYGNTTINGTLIVNANLTAPSTSTWTIYSPVNLYTSTTTFNSNATLSIYAPTTYYAASSLSIYAPTTFFGVSTVNVYGTWLYAQNSSLTINANITTANDLVWSFGVYSLTLCGTVSLCSNKSLTIAELKGNGAGAFPIAIKNNVSLNATMGLPNFSPLQLLGASNASTPLMSPVLLGANMSLYDNGNGTMSLNTDANGSLPQPLDVTDQPTFANVNHSNVTNKGVIGTNGTGALVPGTIQNGITATDTNGVMYAASNLTAFLTVPGSGNHTLKAVGGALMFVPD